jgi:hypothetical protein
MSISKGIADDFDSLTNLLNSLAGDLDAVEEKYLNRKNKIESFLLSHAI